MVVFAPKAAREGVWEPHLRDWLPDLGGVGGTADFSNVVLFSHTDLNRKGDFPERFRHITALADAVIVDEAHHFRNRGRQARPDDLEDRRSRYWRLYDLLDDDVRPKLLFLLTATPINNRLADFRHMAELFTRGDDSYFARTLGVNNFTARFNQLEKRLQESLGGEAASLQYGLYEQARSLLTADEIFEGLVVQRSRAYAKASQLQEQGDSAVFPHRRPPQVAEYSIRKSYGEVLDMFHRAFEKKDPLFSLAIYYPLAHYIGPDEEVSPLEENRQKQVVGLIRILFLKRFESSIHAFERSLDRLMRKLLAFVKVHSETETEKDRYEQWRLTNADMVAYQPTQQLALFDEDETDESDLDEDIVPQELLDNVTDLPRDEYDVAAILDKTYLDLDQIAQFLRATRQFSPAQDDKLKKLDRLLRSKPMAGRKVLVFTEFADTARYLFAQLKDAGVGGLAQLDSGSKANRAEIIRRFSPLLQRVQLGGPVGGGEHRDPGSGVHRHLVRGSQPAGRYKAGQLRHPLEPGPPHATHRAGRPSHESRSGETSHSRPSRSSSRSGQGGLLELPTPRRPQQDPVAVHTGHQQGAADLQDVGYRRPQTAQTRRRLRCSQRVQRFLRGQEIPHRGDAPRVPEAPEPAPRVGGTV